MLEAVATPGHTSNHLCFAWPERGTLFSGDHVMGWATSIVIPPDGDMGDYMASLDKLLGRDDRLYLPTHGPAVADPKARVRELIAHRRAREAAILAQLGAGPESAVGLVAAIYTDTDPSLHPAARLSVLAHLLDLEKRGMVVRDGRGVADGDLPSYLIPATQPVLRAERSDPREHRALDCFVAPLLAMTGGEGRIG